VDELTINFLVAMTGAAGVGAINIFVLNPLRSIPVTLRKIENDLNGMLAREPVKNDQVRNLEKRVERLQQWASQANATISELRAERNIRLQERLRSGVEN
jgi:predicted  nucleic acid-binding Zn-ribbon protein